MFVRSQLGVGVGYVSWDDLVRVEKRLWSRLHLNNFQIVVSRTGTITVKLILPFLTDSIMDDGTILSQANRH